MALSKAKKLKIARRWVVIGGDASFGDRYGKIVSRHKTEGEANKNRRLFDRVRQETDAEVKARLGIED